MQEYQNPTSSELLESRLRMALFIDTPFRVACILCGKNPKTLNKASRKLVGQLTSQFLARSYSDPDFDFGSFYQFSWTDPQRINEVNDGELALSEATLAPTEFYRRLGIDINSLIK